MGLVDIYHRWVSVGPSYRSSTPPLRYHSSTTGTQTNSSWKWSCARGSQEGHFVLSLPISSTNANVYTTLESLWYIIENLLDLKLGAFGNLTISESLEIEALSLVGRLCWKVVDRNQLLFLLPHPRLGSQWGSFNFSQAQAIPTSSKKLGTSILFEQSLRVYRAALRPTAEISPSRHNFRGQRLLKSKSDRLAEFTLRTKSNKRIGVWGFGWSTIP